LFVGGRLTKEQSLKLPDRMNILGISAFYHDSAACLVRDGKIVAAAQEERFSRRKHDAEFPRCAVEYCLREAGLTADGVDLVAFYDKPLLKFDRLIETYSAYAPAGFRSFRQALPVWLRQKLNLPPELDRGLGGRYRSRYVFTEHHESHAASAFFPSPFEEAAILTMDGVGEWATATYGVGRGNQIELSHELRFPHSLGLLYSAFTYFAGFKVNSGEYKLMGLAPYGRPRYRELILEKVVDLREDGSLSLDMSYFDYCHGLRMTNGRFAALFGGPPRRPESPITEREADIAASIQSVTDEVMLRCARHVALATGMRKLVMAGGVALNCVANGRIAESKLFDDIWIQPAAGDAGGSLGAALFVWHQLLGRERQTDGRHDCQFGSLLGPHFSTSEIVEFLERSGAKYHTIEPEERLLDIVATEIAHGKIVGWFHGRLEFGPRALGARSILGDARGSDMQSRMNLGTKFRESFRPFAPSVLREHVHEWFETPAGTESPYMLTVAQLAQAKRWPVKEDDGSGGNWIESRLGVPRSEVPAITHVDYSARLQTVDEERHGRFYRLLRCFFQKTGCPMIINTSFNVRGEPIVCTPAEAYRCFLATNMDVLVLENAVLYRHEQPNAPLHEIDSYLAQRELD
jgi:carbamoyltransferase